MELEELVKERIKENEKLFNKEELILLNNNVSIIKKVYLLALLDTEI